MFGNINPSQMKGMMKKMGIAQTDIKAERVIIECGDKNIVIENPSVMKVSMQGQVSYQISGDEIEEEKSSFNEEDVKMVMEKTGKSKEEVEEFLEKNEGDIAAAIIGLKS
ncbi:nascent polypeptide-associated complex protein [Candidatus Pacearchaeota archaeon]|nr:nascent polypeptide-associated complex protein [Candidatus Pacearchaeota archaeon]